MINTEHATPELLAAMSAAQGEIENATKNAQNSHLKNKYADLAEIINTVREVFPKHGLSITQAPHYDGSLCSVTTMLAHKAGGYITSTASCVPAKSDAQGIGAATTYLRRYSMAAMAGISQEDDDGNSAAHDRKPDPVRKQEPKQQAAPPKAQTDPNHPNLIKIKQVVTEVSNVASLSDRKIENPTQWAKELVAREANALQLSVKAGDIERIAEGAMEILLKRIQDAARAELSPEAANA